MILIAGCVTLGAMGRASARELWRSGDASLEVSGSARSITLYTQGTDAGSFARAVARGLPSPDLLPLASPPGSVAGTDPRALLIEAFPSLRCLSAELFSGCPALDVVGDRDVWQELFRFRTRLDLRLTPQVSGALVYDHELRFGILDTLAAGLAEDIGGDTFLGLEDDIQMLGFRADSKHRRWLHRLYRAYLRFESEHFEVVVGRQRIAWGVGRLWNPIDRLNAIPPLAIEGGETPGVDAIDARWLVSGFSYLEAVWVGADPADDRGWALRWHGVAFDADYSLVFGRLEDARIAGFDLTTNLAGAAVGMEVVYTDPAREVWPLGQSEPRELAPYWQVVASIDRNLEIGSGLYVVLEHLYNGNALGFGVEGAGVLSVFFEATREPPPGVPPQLVPLLPGPFVRPASADVFGASRVVTLSRHTTGLGCGYDLTPILRLNLLTLYDWNGRSAVFFPTLGYTPVSWLELTLGTQASVGGARSEYGDAERLVFLIAEVFF